MSKESASKPAAVTGRSHRRARACPICGKPAVAVQHPFCSKRCRDVDLGRWLKGSYHIPGRAPGLGEEDDEP